MGGRGSGRRYRWDKKTTVEETRWIDASRWMRDGLLAPDVHNTGSWVWTNPHTNESVSIGYEIHTRYAQRPWVRLMYTITPRDGQPELIDYKIPLVTTQPHFGGTRYWFLCPLRSHGTSCLRRVGKLYLPPPGRYFGCRHCHNLTYTSSNESDQRVARLARDFDALGLVVERVLGDETTSVNTADVLKVCKAIRIRSKANDRRGRS